MASYTLGQDYDAFDLLAAITAAYSGSGTSNLFPLLYEGISTPADFLVVCPPNFHLGIDYLNITNSTAAAATVAVQLYEFTSGSGTPYGTPGPVVFTQAIATATTVTIDQTRFRLAASPGFFFLVFSADGTFSSNQISINARARFTPG